MELFHYPYRFVQRIDDAYILVRKTVKERYPHFLEIINSEFTRLYDYFD